MILGGFHWIVVYMVFILIATPFKIGAQQYAFNDDYDYFYLDPGVDESYIESDSDAGRFHKYLLDSSMLPRDAASVDCDPIKVAVGGVGSKQSSQVMPQSMGQPQATMQQQSAPAPAPAAAPAPAPAFAAPAGAQAATNDTSNQKAKELQSLVQHLYIAEARVQLEANEIKKAQAVAQASQEQLEEAANHVRIITAALASAQQEVASAAMRAQTAQLQLAAHDQLLFAARQNVDALSSQMVGLQAEAGIAPPPNTFNLPELLAKLKKPLAEQEKPTPVPAIIQPPAAPGNGKSARMTVNHFW